MGELNRFIDKMDEQTAVARLIRQKLWARCPHCRTEQARVVLLGGKLYVSPKLRVLVFICQNPVCGKTVHWGAREEKANG